MRSMKAPETAAEGELRLPTYPAAAGSIEVSLQVADFPFSVFIDPDSISIDNRRDVRYTVILKADSGATNVFYEAIRCDTGQYRRYAYGSSGQFKVLPVSEWRFIRAGSADRYRGALLKYYLCPLPARNAAEILISRLRQRGPASSFDSTQ